MKKNLVQEKNARKTASAFCRRGQRKTRKSEEAWATAETTPTGLDREDFEE